MVLLLHFALFLDYLFGLDDWSKINDLKTFTPLLINEAAGVIPSAVVVWIAINTPFILQLNFNASSQNLLKENDPRIRPLAEIIKKFRSIGRDLIPKFTFN